MFETYCTSTNFSYIQHKIWIFGLKSKEEQRVRCWCIFSEFASRSQSFTLSSYACRQAINHNHADEENKSDACLCLQLLKETCSFVVWLCDHCIAMDFDLWCMYVPCRSTCGKESVISQPLLILRQQNSVFNEYEMWVDAYWLLSGETTFVGLDWDRNTPMDRPATRLSPSATSYAVFSHFVLPYAGAAKPCQGTLRFQ